MQELPNGPPLQAAGQHGPRLGWLSGMGMVVANTIGAGVFLSTGFMAQELTPGWILMAWGIGMVQALVGAMTYATVAQYVPRSGGEYRYLSTLLHPAVGYLAGWASLLVGFSAPLAVQGLAVGAFAQTLWSGASPLWVAVVAIVALTLMHAFDLRLSVWTQNVLVWFKILLVLAFVAMGLALGRHAWPGWQPSAPVSGRALLASLSGSLFYIAFAFSGWNAAAYAAEEFENPAQNVPRSMWAGCLLVGVIYLLVNWIFVANLTPERAAVVFKYESARVTLGHLVSQDLIGQVGARLMSVLILIALVSAMSAISFLGPRVYAAMAKDGFLPSFLAERQGKPPVGSVLLQGGLALTLVASYSLQQVLQNIGAILTLFSSLVAVGLIRLYFRSDRAARPSWLRLACAVLYLISAAGMLGFGFRDSKSLLWWLAAAGGAAWLAYALTERLKRRRAV